MNHTIYADDCLNVLDDELALPTESIDLIYLDPPFNSNSHYNLPFASLGKNIRAVEAFKDTWEWGEKEDAILARFKDGPKTKILADIISLSDKLHKPFGRSALSAYLVNMACRLISMRRVLKNTGSIYLHCDPTASHYLKILMDTIFGADNFKNEVIWYYKRWTNASKNFQRMHDIIFLYTLDESYTWNKLYQPFSEKTAIAKYARKFDDVKGVVVQDKSKVLKKDPKKGVAMHDVWEIPFIHPISKERLGYPTQKPLALLDRIIQASSNKGDTVLDPFCGCGTTLHAAEKLKRKWVGIDISRFSAGLIHGRLTSNFNNLKIAVHGVPQTIEDALALAEKDKFEFEKWVCGHIGVNGMYHNPGDKGADGGVDGVLEVYPFRFGKDREKRLVIIQVKGGGVTPDAVGRLYSTVKQFKAIAGVMICFEKYLKTVSNNRNREMFSDNSGEYPVIQALSIEDMLKGKAPRLPVRYTHKSGRIKSAF